MPHPRGSPTDSDPPPQPAEGAINTSRSNIKTTARMAPAPAPTTDSVPSPAPDDEVIDTSRSNLKSTGDRVG
jgi:hypothetical protein